MISSRPQPDNLTVNLLLEKTSDGRSKATVLEFPDCSIEAQTDEQAIEQLRQLVTQRLRVVQVMPLNISYHSQV